MPNSAHLDENHTHHARHLSTAAIESLIADEEKMRGQALLIEVDCSFERVDFERPDDDPRPPLGFLLVERKVLV